MTKKRFRCRIGLHDWQRVEGTSVKCGKCPACLRTYCTGSPLWDQVCIAPGCRATNLVATEAKARRQGVKELQKDRKHLAELKMELIRDEREH